MERTKYTFRLHNATQYFQLSHLSSPQTFCLHTLSSLCWKEGHIFHSLFQDTQILILEQTDYTPEEPNCCMVTFEIIILKAINTSARAFCIGIKYSLGQAQQGHSNYQDFTNIKSFLFLPSHSKFSSFYSLLSCSYQEWNVVANSSSLTETNP